VYLCVNIVYMCENMCEVCMNVCNGVCATYKRENPPIPCAISHTSICFRFAASFPSIPVHTDDLMTPASIERQTDT